MRIHSFIKVCLAVLAIAFAMTMSTVHGSTRMHASPVLTSNVTQVRVGCQPPNVWCEQYNKIALARWVRRTNDGKVTNFVEVSHDNNTMRLFSASPGETVLGETVDFDFSRMTFGSGVTSRVSPNVLIGGSSQGTITGVYEISADNSPETCTQQTTAPGAKCTCDLRTLRPLQGAVGMEEVRKKANDIKDAIKISETDTRLDLAYDPIKIVRGPNGLLYVTDHHHGARAWLEAHTMGTCQIQSDPISTDPTQFWVDLNKLNLVRLADKDGKSITTTQLQAFTLATLPDDPYRTLAWRVRKGDGFCRALMAGNKEFAEFRWADWLRKRPEFTPAPGPNGKWTDPKRDAAIALAKSTAAADMVPPLPGYRGDQPLAYICAADPD